LATSLSKQQIALVLTTYKTKKQNNTCTWNTKKNKGGGSSGWTDWLNFTEINISYGISSHELNSNCCWRRILPVYVCFAWCPYVFYLSLIDWRSCSTNVYVRILH